MRYFLKKSNYSKTHTCRSTCEHSRAAQSCQFRSQAPPTAATNLLQQDMRHPAGAGEDGPPAGANALPEADATADASAADVTAALVEEGEQPPVLAASSSCL